MGLVNGVSTNVGLSNEERRTNVEIEYGVKGLRIHLGKRLRPVGTRVVEQNTQPVDAFDPRVKRLVGNVLSPGLYPARWMLGRFRKVGFRSRDRNDARTRIGERLRTAAANAASGARYQRHLSLEVHKSPPSRFECGCNIA